jgi:hypothetical protein
LVGVGDTEFTVMLLAWGAVASAASVTCSVNEHEFRVGVPDTTPTFATVLSVAQEHKLPAMMLQL